VKVAENEQDILSKSLKGKLPILELDDGKTYISEPISIARVFSNNKLNFYGPDIA